MSARLAAALACALAGALALAGCAGTSGGTKARHASTDAAAPAPDSVTVALWHLDENGGTAAEDAGPFRLRGTAGIDTRTDFGRFRSAREFQYSKDSFVFVPHNPVLDVGGPFTIEAWIQVTATTSYELSVIASRWTPVPNTQSWVFGVTGQGQTSPSLTSSSPGWFVPIVQDAAPLHLVFGFVPAGAGAPRGYFSTSELPQGRWAHVAATVDGDAVKLYVDGRLDAQYVMRSTIRASSAPLMIGNDIDPRSLTAFGGDLRADLAANVQPAYSFVGLIDEVRLSKSARTTFASTRGY